MLRGMLLSCLCFGVLPPALKADTVSVPGDYATIQAAIDAATSNRTIELAPGTYVGNVDLGFTHQINIRGVGGAAVTVLQGDGTADVVTAARGGTILEGVTVTGGLDGLSVVTTDVFSLVDCVFADNAEYGLDVLTLDLGFAVVGCRFEGNGLGGASLDQVAPGVFSAPGVRQCVFRAGNDLRVGVDRFGLVACHVRNCSFDGADIQVQGLALVTSSIVRGGTVSSGVALNINYSNIEGGAVGDGNIDADPDWVDAAGGDYALLPGSPCINAGDPGSALDADGTVTDMGAVPWVTWVDLGAALAGLHGAPQLVGAGSLEDLSPLAIELTGARENAVTFLVAGVWAVDLPFYGGTLVPAFEAPFGTFVVLATDGNGASLVEATWPMSINPGLTLHLQHWIVDPAGPHGFAASNAVRGTVP